MTRLLGVVVFVQIALLKASADEARDQQARLAQFPEMSLLRTENKEKMLPSFQSFQHVYVSSNGRAIERKLHAAALQEPTPAPCWQATIMDENGKPALPCSIEQNSRTLVRKWVKPDSVVLEIGARYGSVSCTVANQQHQSGRVVSVEPDRAVWDALEKNLHRKKCKVNVLKGVVGNESQVLMQYGYDGYGSYTLPQGLPQKAWWNLWNDNLAQAAQSVFQTNSAVPHYSFTQVQEHFGFHFDTVLVDCEGCFPKLLAQNPEIAKQAKLFIVEAHNPDEEASVSKLQEQGFKLAESLSRQRVLVWDPSWKPPPDVPASPAALASTAVAPEVVYPPLPPAHSPAQEVLMTLGEAPDSPVRKPEKKKSAPAILVEHPKIEYHTEHAHVWPHMAFD